jgi:hypothetical protein
VSTSRTKSLALLFRLVDERADELGADAATLIAGVDFDAGEIAFAWPVFDVDRADVCPFDGDDPPAVRGEGVDVEGPLDQLVPPPDRGDVIAHGGLVQLVAELAVGGCGRPLRDSPAAVSAAGLTVC